MLSFEVRGDPPAVCEAVRVFTYAKSLGGVESLIDRRGPSLLRVSVGCEHVEDLWADLDLRLILAEDVAQRAADLADGGVVLERLADRRQQVSVPSAACCSSASARSVSSWSRSA